MEVTLEQMLAAREDRAFRQFQRSREFGLPILSFSMNIPGPVKDSPLIRRGFRAGCAALDEKLPREAIRCREVIPAPTGWEALYVLDMAAEAVKAITTAIEDTHGLGRLFDMDVLDERLNKLDRALVGGRSRDCMVCGAPGRGCASRRVHAVPELQEAVQSILTRHFAREDACRIGGLAADSLIREVRTTPKPGLVDLRNNGSHRDMDLSTFLASAQALRPYFQACAQIGMDTAGKPPRETFPLLRKAGLEAEGAMYAATGGVNTHKGAIFTMGVLCAAAGRLWRPEGGWSEGDILREVAAMTREAMEEDFLQAGSATAGQRLYLRQGIRGIRGEAAQGLPSVEKVGLPAYRRAREQGLSPNDAGVMALLHLMAEVEDTCLIHRGGLQGAREARERAARLLAQGPSLEEVRELDDWFIARNLSPGGSADLLAAAYFLDQLTISTEKEGKLP